MLNECHPAIDRRAYIPFHRGELGKSNKVILLAFAAGILFSLVSGWMMFFLRRRGHGAPPAAILVGRGLCALLPLMAVSTLLLIGVEVVLARRQRAPVPAV